MAQDRSPAVKSDDRRLNKGDVAPHMGVLVPAYNYYQYSACCAKVDHLGERLVEAESELDKQDHSIWGDILLPALVGIAIGIGVGRASL